MKGGVRTLSSAEGGTASTSPSGEYRKKVLYPITSFLAEAEKRGK